MKLRGSLSESAVEHFLQETTVPLRLGCRTPSDAPWMLSLWYRYRDGRLECATERSADVISYLEYDPVVSFEISTNEPPYKGVRGNGTATVEPDPEKTLLRSLLERYLGTTENGLAKQLLADDREEVTITIEPRVCYGWDFSKRMGETHE